jgi:hypothetical protein
VSYRVSNTTGGYNLSITANVSGTYSINLTVNNQPITSDCLKFPVFSVVPGIASHLTSSLSGGAVAEWPRSPARG